MVNLFDHLPDSFRNGSAYVKNDYRELVNLGSNELHDPALSDFSKTFLEQVHFDWFHQYPYYPDFRAFAAQVFQKDIRETLLFPGSDGAIYTLLRILCYKHRQLILQSPNYYNYENYALLLGLKIELVYKALPHETTNWIEHFKERLKKATPSLVILTNPCGISGQLLSIDSIGELVSMARQNGHLVLLDEAYIGFQEEHHLDLINVYENLLILRTFSKFPAMAGLRLSLLFGHSNLIDFIEKINPMNGTSRFSLEYFKAIYQNPELLDLVRKNVGLRKEELKKRLQHEEIHIQHLETQTNFLLLQLETKEQIDGLISHYRSNGFLIKSMYAYQGYQKYLRIALPPLEHSSQFIELFKQWTP